MSNDDGEQPSPNGALHGATTPKARWIDLARGVLIVGVAGALVVAGVGPASSALMPNATLGRRLAATITTSTPATDRATVVSFARTAAALDHQVMTGDFAAAAAVEPLEVCVPCVHRHSASVPDPSRHAGTRPVPARRAEPQPEGAPAGNTASAPAESTTATAPTHPTKTKPPSRTTDNTTASAPSSPPIATAAEGTVPVDHGTKSDNDKKVDAKPETKSGRRAGA